MKVKGRVKDLRGSANDRFERKSWLIGLKYSDRYGWAPYGGDGERVACVHCGELLMRADCDADRIVPETEGGNYQYSNVQPSCEHCNASRGNDVEWVGPTGWKPLSWEQGEKTKPNGKVVWVGQGWRCPDGSLMPALRGARPVVVA